MTFADLELARRLERTEGHACAMFAEARCRITPESGAGWMECGGAYVVFDGVESPLTQTFGLGVFQKLSSGVLDEIERYFRERHAPVNHEVSPLAGVVALTLLCDRGYRPVEISNVMVRAVDEPAAAPEDGIRVRVTTAEEAPLWAGVSATAWTHEHPELQPFMKDIGTISAARAESPCFLADIDGQPGAAGALCIHQGVALFAGASTIPELRRRGLQGALLRERMRYAFQQGCDLAMMVAEAGSDSQRNAERKGFRVAYTRTKWYLPAG